MIIEPLVTALASMAVGVLTRVIRDIVRKRSRDTRVPHSERLSELTASLTKASSEVDEILRDLAQVANERARAVKQLEVELVTMEGRERELKERITVLEQTPIAVAEHFAKLMAPGERRSAYRDYMLFGAGVVVSTLIGIVIQMFLK